jgi:predicted peptidase
VWNVQATEEMRDTTMMRMAMPAMIALLMLWSGSGFAAPQDRMEAREFKDAQGQALKYRLWVPKKYDAKNKYPLILFLHGAGERGDDNKAQIKHAQVLNLVTGKQPAFLVAPQCPRNVQWVATPWGSKKPHKTPKKPTVQMKLSLELLSSLEKEFSIDDKRRYVTGLSMGGFGTYDAVVRRPDYFAAAVPICGGADNSQAKLFVKTPVWVFHGDKDTVVHTVRSRSLVEAVKKAGGKPRYSEYKGIGHFAWGRAYEEPDLPAWLFSQKR